MPRVETDRRRRWAASFMLTAVGNTLLDPAEVEVLRWNRLLKTALPTEPLRGRFMLSLFSLDMVAEGGAGLLGGIWDLYKSSVINAEAVSSCVALETARDGDRLTWFDV
jgi:hypothetical protein